MNGTFEMIPSEVLARRDISGNAKCVFAFMRPLIAKRMTPGTRLVGERCGMSHGTAKRAVRELVEAGLIEAHVERKPGRRAEYELPKPGHGWPTSGPRAAHCDKSARATDGPLVGHERPAHRATDGPLAGHEWPTSIPHTNSIPVPDHPPCPPEGVEEVSSAEARSMIDDRASAANESSAAWLMRFERAWSQATGGTGLGVWSPRHIRQVDQLRRSGAAPDVATWDAEVAAYVEQITTGDWMPQSPWAHFASKVGSWRSSKPTRRKRPRIAPASSREAFEPRPLEEILAAVEAEDQAKSRKVKAANG